MDTTERIDEILLARMATMRKEELTKMLRCIICDGLFRFAHTIVDCGHTFCQVCIFKYIKGFKGRKPAIKCPECHLPVNSNHKRSIFRDIFKQTLVDAIAPQYSQVDQIIAKRVQQLFPEFELEYIFEQFKFTSFEKHIGSNKKDQDGSIYSNLAEKIKEKFNITFETFAQMIVSQHNFNKFQQIVKNAPPESIVLSIKPKTERDFSFIGINNNMKSNNISVVKLQRFIQKKTLQRINQTQKVPMEWVNGSDDKLDIKIFLQINGREIEAQDDLTQLLKTNKGEPIYYTLSKPSISGVNQLTN